MRFKKPLARADLEALQARNLDSNDMKAALWEIARLRSLVLLTDQLQRMLGTLPGQQGDLLEMIRTKLADEPCVHEFPKLQPDAGKALHNPGCVRMNSAFCRALLRDIVEQKRRSKPHG